jgi:rubrerythrin
MNVFEFALQKEKSSEELYRRLSEKATNKGLKRICDMLADEENSHYKVIEKMRKNAPAQVKSTTLPDDAVQIFSRMHDSTERFDFDVTELQLYQKARDMEKESESFYREQAKAAGEALRGIFRKLAAEEHKHYFLLQSICDFVAKPQTFLENAEFNHIKDYAEGIF